jgi:hypothetical protein
MAAAVSRSGLRSTLCASSASERHHPDTETPSPARVGNPRMVVAGAGALVVRDTGAFWVAHSRAPPPASGWHRDRGIRSGCRETISTPAARTISTVASAGSTVTSQPTPEAASRAKVRAVARPMLQSLPVTMQTLPAQPARHLSGPPRLQRRASPRPQRPPARCASGPR